jgi:multidrug efflux pump subunit AcrA (membrane-fusion protein)
MLVSLHSDVDSVGTGTVVDVGAAIDSLTRGVGVRVRVTSTTRSLRLGESVRGSVALVTTPNAITVPLAALVPTGEAFRVFVVDSSDVVHVREVTVSGKDATRAHISAGLAAGERVVTSGAYGMDEGARLAPVRPSR